MTDPGLRERKKARTRQVIADAAARLFAERGYEQVAVSDVAREAEVSEQTVYNYFQTKDQLVTDRDQLIQDELRRLIRTRAPGTTPAAAIREFVLDTVEGIRRIPAGQWRGELGFLAAISPTVHRLALELSDRQASALAAAIAETEAVAPADRKAAGNRARQRLPDHHHRGRTPHPRGPKPGPDRRRAAASHRSGPRRPRPLAYACDEMRACQSHSLPCRPSTPPALHAAVNVLGPFGCRAYRTGQYAHARGSH